jgi:regulator of sirC expression with transglutaminase-like and TPR domain
LDKKEIAMASHKMMTVLFDELEQECLNTVKYIEALKVVRLSKNQKEDILGELSAAITHLRIQTEQFDKHFEELA